MRDTLIKDFQITASSSLSSATEPKYARLSNESHWTMDYLNWSPGSAWIQVDFLRVLKVETIITQGGENVMGPGWVTSYKVSYGYDGIVFQEYKENGVIKVKFEIPSLFIEIFVS